MVLRRLSGWPAAGRRHRRRTLVVAAAIVAVVLASPSYSYTMALTAPGHSTWQNRTVDWLRENGAGPLINAGENWYYTRHEPADTAPDPTALPHRESSSGLMAPIVAQGPHPRPLALEVGRPPLAGEGVWMPARTDSHGVPLVWTSFLRPAGARASVVAGVAWIRQSGTDAHLVAGTVQPGGRGWPGNAAVPTADTHRLVATFNSGWRMSDIRGGFFSAARSGPPLVDGEATAAIDDRGQLTVGQWGRDLHMSRHLVSARQNLQLIVDHGRKVTDLATNSHGQWGTPKNQFQYTARSALGVDHAGHLIYVAGTQLNLDALSTAMTQAGAERAMELDMHTGMTAFSSWSRSPDGGLAPTKLLPSMPSPADRYLAPDQHDFFYLTAG